MLAPRRRMRKPIGPRVKRRIPTRPGRVGPPSKPGRVRPPRSGRVSGHSKPGRVKRVIDKSPAARQAFLQSLTKEELEKRVRRDPRRTPGKPRPVRVQKDPRRTPGKPRVQEPSKRVKEPVKGALPSKRVKEPSKIERVSKERPSKVQPRVRKRRKSKGPSYTSTSLNV